MKINAAINHLNILKAYMNHYLVNQPIHIKTNERQKEKLCIHKKHNIKTIFSCNTAPPCQQAADSGEWSERQPQVGNQSL